MYRKPSSNVGDTLIENVDFGESVLSEPYDALDYGNI
jgi:hypothetical protein